MSVNQYRYNGKRRLCLKDVPTDAVGRAAIEERARRQTQENLAEAALLQEKLFAAGQEGLVIALQARDAAGKDSLIKKVFSGLNPAALEVHSFKAPSSVRAEPTTTYGGSTRLCPPRGKIGPVQPLPVRGCAGRAGASSGEGLSSRAPLSDGRFF